MKDYVKVEQAVKLLEESGVEFLMAYNNAKANTCRTHAYGTYSDVKSCAVGALMRLGGLIKENGYGDMIMVKELQDISLKALQMIYESEEEKHD